MIPLNLRSWAAWDGSKLGLIVPGQYTILLLLLEIYNAITLEVKPKEPSFSCQF
jgi:hypothetical protein